MPGSHLEWTAIGLCLVLIGLKSGGLNIWDEKRNTEQIFSETEGLPQVCPQVTQGSSGLKWCAPRCQVLICPECCFNPICKTKRRKQCEWTQYLCANAASCNPPSDSGNLGLIKNVTILEASMETKLHQNFRKWSTMACVVFNPINKFYCYYQNHTSYIHIVIIAKGSEGPL